MGISGVISTKPLKICYSKYESDIYFGMKRIVLIDYENVQPHNIHLLEKYRSIKPILFLGIYQQHIVREILEYAKFNKIGYVQINGTGKNNLDFHISYYLGKYAKKKVQIYVLSKDKGYDHVIKHANKKRKYIKRICDLTELDQMLISDPKNLRKNINQVPSKKNQFLIKETKTIVLNYFINPQNSHPKCVMTLRNKIRSLTQNTITSSGIDEIVQWLVDIHIINLGRNDRIQYYLSKKRNYKQQNHNSNIVLHYFCQKRGTFPARRESLRNMIRSLSIDNIQENEIDHIIDWLHNEKHLFSFEGSKVMYNI